MVKEQRILRSRRKMGDPLDTREERRRRRENGTQDIVGYEIGSGYGPLNDDAENVASRRRWRFCNDGRLFAKDKKVLPIL